MNYYKKKFYKDRNCSDRLEFTPKFIKHTKIYDVYKNIYIFIIIDLFCFYFLSIYMVYFMGYTFLETKADKPYKYIKSFT